VWSREKLTAPRDSVIALVRRAVVSLLAAMSGEPEDHLVALEKLPESYLRNYLAARRAYFQGDYPESVRLYEQVLGADSTCFPAALGLATAAFHSSSDSAQRRDLALVRALRNRMQSHDLPYLAALDTNQAPVFDRIKVLRAWNDAADAAPRPELWYELGEKLFHEGPWTGAPDVLNRAKAAFRSALALEPDFVPALRHVIDLAASQDSLDEVRELGPRYLALDSVGDLADYYRWRIAVALNDGGTLKKLRQRFDGLPEPTLERMINVSQLDGVGLEDGAHAAEVLWTRSGEWNSSRWRYTKRIEIARNRGRPAEALAIMRRRMAGEQPLRQRDHLSEVVDALYWDADTTLAAQLMAEVTETVDRHALVAVDPSDPTYFDICALALWRIAHHDLASVPALTADLRRGQRAYENAPATTSRQGSFSGMGMCADMLDAQLAAATHAPDLRARVAQIDSTTRRSDAITWVLAAANLTAARLWEQLGDLDRALTATRRRLYITDLKEQRVLVALSTFLREEGRLAAKTGDKPGAIRAYTKYLAIRANPEPVLAPQVARVRAALDSLRR
jgi:tetratricopeptide (TPR) repeat protein